MTATVTRPGVSHVFVTVIDQIQRFWRQGAFEAGAQSLHAIRHEFPGCGLG